MRQAYYVESCDPDEGQVFGDIVVARDEDEAQVKVEAVRGCYASAIEATPLHQWLNTQRELIARLEQTARLPLRVIDQQWRDFARKEAS